MKFELTIESEDAAATDAPLSETIRILGDVVAKLTDGHDSGVLHDVNGNRVGAWRLELPEADDEEEDGAELHEGCGGRWRATEEAWGLIDRCDECDEERA